MGKGTMNGLLDELLQTRVLNQEEVEEVQHENATVTAKARALLDTVIQKGTLACQICITYICEEKRYLAWMLVLSAAPQAVPVWGNPAMPTSSGSGRSVKLCSLDEAKRIWKEKSTDIYPIMDKSSRTRLALIICNEEFDSLSKRTGAEVDIIGITMLLQNLGYKVDVKRNLTASEMTTELEAFARRQEYKTSDSTFLVFMSHGFQEGICGKKYSEQVPDVLQLNAIFKMLNTRNCPSLKDKPKVIIIQACRGEPWCGVGKDSDDAIKKAQIEKDFIAFCSSTSDSVSWRHPTKGSVFIMRLIEHLQEYACSCDVEEIFCKVRLSFEQPDDKAQTPSTERVTSTRRFYFFPGH
uniref:Caspase-1 n=1 Tax=Mandrillus leucophaeus TaxID=9568 RepID=A0A2K5YFQ2_MANLE